MYVLPSSPAREKLLLDSTLPLTHRQQDVGEPSEGSCLP